MRMHERIFLHLLRTVATVREPDRVIGSMDDPYLLRWHLTPWSNYDRDNPKRSDLIKKKLLPSLYLHKFTRSDHDTALHDHPGHNVGLILHNGYDEEFCHAGGVHYFKHRTPGAVSARRAGTAHRVQLHNAWHVHGAEPATPEIASLLARTLGPSSHPDRHEVPSWSLFLVSPQVREWGFHCPKGWRHWKEFLGRADSAHNDGAGCD